MMAKSRKWWNEGDRTAGLRIIYFMTPLGAYAPDAYVFETETYEDIRKIITYWKAAEFDIHPAMDFTKIFQPQSMPSSNTRGTP